jgi:hypothetical protein
MTENWLELCPGGVPVSISLQMSLDDLRDIANKAPETKGISRQLELCLVGLAAYFEAFCKDLFALSLNVYPELLERLLTAWEGRDFSIDPLLAVRLGDSIRDKIGFIISERLDFGTARAVNALYTRLLKITPFAKDEMQQFSELLRDRNVFVHHGGMLTYQYLQQVKRSHTDAHFDSLVVDRAFYFRHHDFIEGIARKMLKGAHRELTEFGKTQYGFRENAPVDSLLHWESREPRALDAIIDECEAKSLYSQMLDKQDAERRTKAGEEDGGDEKPF